MSTPLGAYPARRNRYPDIAWISYNLFLRCTIIRLPPPRPFLFFRDSMLHLHSFSARRGCVILEMETVSVSKSRTTEDGSQPKTRTTSVGIPDLAALLFAMEVQGVAGAAEGVVVSIQASWWIWGSLFAVIRAVRTDIPPSLLLGGGYTV